MKDTPLCGTLSSLDDLFVDYRYCTSLRLAPEGYVPLLGLPGTVDLSDRTFLFVRPRADVRDTVAARCTNGAIGSFRSVRSARFMSEGLLPVFARDLPDIAGCLVALVPYAEHERFSRGAA